MKTTGLSSNGCNPIHIHTLALSFCEKNSVSCPAGLIVFQNQGNELGRERGERGGCKGGGRV